MTTTAPAMQRLQALRDKTRSLPRPWVSEIVLQTNQYDLMRLWYEAVLGGEWFVENAPDPSVKVENHHGDGGKQVHAKDVRSCFMRLPTVEPYGQILALFELTWLSHAPAKDPGINHLQFKHADLNTLITRVELLRDAGLDPHRSANHGPMTSFYFRDPDENILELCVDNFKTPAEMLQIIRSPAFRANPSGIDFDRDDFIRRYRSGEKEADLLKLRS